MSELEDLVEYTFYWHTQARACRYCMAIPKIIRDQDVFNPLLLNPVNGQPIWDLDNDRSLMHGASGTCRCNLAMVAEVDWSKWHELNAMRQIIQRMR